MISDSMFHYIACLPRHISHDSLIRTITNWIILICYKGFCKSEWCSDHHTAFETINDPQWGDWAMPLSIISDDFAFTTESGLCQTDIHSAHDEDNIFTMICIRKQKNNDNRQKLTY